MLKGMKLIGVNMAAKTPNDPKAEMVLRKLFYQEWVLRQNPQCSQKFMLAKSKKMNAIRKDLESMDISEHDYGDYKSELFAKWNRDPVLVDKARGGE